MKLPRLYAITDGARLGEDLLLERLESAFRGGLHMVQLRERGLDDAAYRALFARVRERAPESTVIVLNRRVALVDELGAAGVHLGGDPELVRGARTRLPDGSLIGYSAHAIDEIELVASLGADYVSFSPIFPPSSKSTSLPAVGLEALREAAARSPIPVFALGGVTPERVADIAATGTHGVAAIGAILDASDPAIAVVSLRRALEAAPVAAPPIDRDRSMTRTETRTADKSPPESWARYREYLCAPKGLGLRVDPSRMDFDETFLDSIAPSMLAALDAMEALESGARANPDEKDDAGEPGRMVGHYWLRDPARAPRKELREAIEKARDDVVAFAAEVHAGKVKPPSSELFLNVLVIGIGGSALGPQLVSDALGDLRGPDGATSGAAMRVFFFDNTDPDGMDRVLRNIESCPGGLAATLAIVISKSGGTPETRNGMREAEKAWERAGLDFAKHAVAITKEGSALDTVAAGSGDERRRWLKRFPMWDYVGGRTSETSAVGLLPAALQGIDIMALLGGARAMDEATRERNALENPAALLAMMWHRAGNGRGDRDMVLLPYKDRLLLLSRYLQQLVMESLGKELDLENRLVKQGLVVYGNKGSTDQHAYIQQLRDGAANFFVTFVDVLEDRVGASIEVDPRRPGVTSGDFLKGFFLGTRSALLEKGRGSITITVDRVDAATIGKLIALFERAVGLYASLIGINAYHQPGVQAGKDAANDVLELQADVWRELEARPDTPRTAEEIAAAIGRVEETETVFHLLEHRAANPASGGLRREQGDRVFDSRYWLAAR